MLTEHVGSSLESLGLQMLDIADTIGDRACTTLCGCAFEDFLTRRFGPDAKNPVEDYLRRHAWKEGVQARGYMTGLKNSIWSLYEVSDIVPGVSCRVRDLIRGGEPVLVHERSATRQMKPWDRIAARLVPEESKTILSGGLMVFSLEVSQMLFAELAGRSAPGGKRQKNATAPLAAMEHWSGTDEDLRRAASCFTKVWLDEALRSALGLNRPAVLTAEGDEVVFHTTKFPLAATAALREIRKRLNRMSSLRQQEPTSWNWIGPPAETRMATVPGGPKAVIWNVTLDDGSVALGKVELTGRTLSLEVSSSTRAARGTEMLRKALAGLVGEPRTEVQTIEQAQAACRGDEVDSHFSPEEQTEIIHAALDKHYRAMLDQPVEMLSNLSLRAAARSANGRRNLVAWLKQAENHGRAEEGPMATYDFTWLWRELKVEQLRN